jgi:hypothetical protein
MKPHRSPAAFRCGYGLRMLSATGDEDVHLQQCPRNVAFGPVGNPSKAALMPEYAHVPPHSTKN